MTLVNSGHGVFAQPDDLRLIVSSKHRRPSGGYPSTLKDGKLREETSMS